MALRDAGRFLDLVGECLHGMIVAHPASQVFTNHEAVSVRQTASGWRVTLRDAAGHTSSLICRHVILATGAEQPMARLAQERLGGESILTRCGDRLLQSGDVLGTGGLAQVAARLAGRKHPRVAVIGGSTSAAAVCHALLHRLPGVRFGDGALTLLHRRALRIYYPDTGSALAEGYTEFTADDLCPVSGRVFRFAGFRLDSRELLMQVRGIGNRPAEPRMVLHALQEVDPEGLQILDAADIVVAAMGYRPRAALVQDRSGAPITLLAHTGPQAPLVDGACRVLDAAARRCRACSASGWPPASCRAARWAASPASAARPTGCGCGRTTWAR